MEKQELEDLLFHRTEELNAIKNVLAIFLDKVYDDIDNLTPEDIEYKLMTLEVDTYKKVTGSTDLEPSPMYQIREIMTLCRTLGSKDFNLPDYMNIKMFIKTLARDNYKLKMEGAKQTNGDPKPNNLGSGSTTNSD